VHNPSEVERWRLAAAVVDVGFFYSVTRSPNRAAASTGPAIGVQLSNQPLAGVMLNIARSLSSSPSPSVFKHEKRQLLLKERKEGRV
jgi:hypothetical protein